MPLQKGTSHDTNNMSFRGKQDVFIKFEMKVILRDNKI